MYPITIQTNPYHAAASRGLITNQFISIEPFAPEWAEAAVRRTGDRVLIDAHGGSEKTRDKIITARTGATGDNHAPDRNPP